VVSDVVTKAVICWHTEYPDLAVDQLREAGREVDAEVLGPHLPARSSVVNYYGSITVDYELNSPSSTSMDSIISHAPGTFPARPGRAGCS
jgi:hypothetical protein